MVIHKQLYYVYVTECYRIRCLSMLVHLCIHQSLRNYLEVGAPAIPKPVPVKTEQHEPATPKPVPMTQQTPHPKPAATPKPGPVKTKLPSLFKTEHRVKIEQSEQPKPATSGATKKQSKQPASTPGTPLPTKKAKNSENTPCTPALLKQAPVATPVALLNAEGVLMDVDGSL